MFLFFHFISRFWRGPGGNGHVSWQRSKPYAVCKGDCESCRVRIHQDSHWCWYQTALGPQTALVQVLSGTSIFQEMGTKYFKPKFNIKINAVWFLFPLRPARFELLCIHQENSFTLIYKELFHWPSWKFCDSIVNF